MPYYFTGNVFNDRFNMEKSYRPEWGDKKDEPRNDYDRAMDSYEAVRAMAPNYVQMHHQVGTLYMKMHDYMMKQGKPKEAEEFLDKALARFNLYENLDPVYPVNYFRKAQVYIMRNDLKSAEREYLNNINAWKCYVPGHNHGSAEAYTTMANVQYAQGKYGEAVTNYRKALEMDPNFEQARRNLPIAAGRAPGGMQAPARN